MNWHRLTGVAIAIIVLCAAYIFAHVLAWATGLSLTMAIGIVWLACAFLILAVVLYDLWRWGWRGRG